jgi:hypothetical protein
VEQEKKGKSDWMDRICPTETTELRVLVGAQKSELDFLVLKCISALICYLHNTPKKIIGLKELSRLSRKTFDIFTKYFSLRIKCIR